MDISPEVFLSGWYKFAKDKLGYTKSKEEWIEDRKRGCIDLFWLAKHCLKLDLVDSYVCPLHPIMMGPEPEACKICGQMYEPCPGLTPGISVHREICNAFVHKNPNETLFNQDTKKTRAIFCPRGSFKSSLDMADCVQWVVCFPDIRILIFSASPDLGAAFVSNIKAWFTLAKMDAEKDVYECNKEFDLFQQLYPEHLVSSTRRESEDQFTTPARKKKWVEPTVFTLPLEGNTAGFHADVGKFDDCVSDSNSGPKSTEEQRKKVGENIRLKRKLILLSGYVDYVGTPYAEDDAYSHLLQYRKPEVVLVRPAWEIKPASKTKRSDELGPLDYSLLLPTDGKGAPLLTYQALKAEMDDDERLFNCQYLCDARPAKEAIVFTDHIIDNHTIASEGLPQAGTYKICSVWDCASSDNKGSDYSVGGVGYFCIAGPLVGRMFVVDIVRGKFSRFDLPHQIAKQAANFRVERLGVEKSPGADYMHNDIMRELVVCGYPDCPMPEWFPVDNHKDAKALRIEGLASMMEQDRLYFLNTIQMDQVKKELLGFKRGSRRKDDTADMLAMLTRYMPTNIELPKNEQERESRAQQWFKEKFKHDMIYDPEFVKNLPGVLQKPTAEKPFETPTEIDGYPVMTQEQQLYGT